jgi:hypothetical protein
VVRQVEEGNRFRPHSGNQQSPIIADRRFPE